MELVDLFSILDSTIAVVVLVWIMSKLLVIAEKALNEAVTITHMLIRIVARDVRPAAPAPTPPPRD